MTYLESIDNAIRQYKTIRTRVSHRMINHSTPVREIEVLTFTLTIDYLRYLRNEYLKAKAIINQIQQEQISNV